MGFCVCENYIIIYNKIMLLRKKSKLILLFMAVALAAFVLLGVGIFNFGKVTFLNLGSVGKLKPPISDLLEPPQECLSQSDGYKKWSCFRPYFETLTHEISASASIAEATKFEQQGIVSDCHLFAHFTGEAALEKHNFDIGKALSSCTVGKCRYGCFHGVMGRYIGYEIEPRSVASTIKNACDGVGLDSNQKRNECIHGIGHGLLAHNYLPFQDAVYACEALGPPDRKQRICVGGVVMEKMFQYLSLDPDNNQLKEIIPEMCAPFESIGPRFMDVCIYNITLELLFYTGYDIERTEELCEGFPQQDYSNACKNYIPVHIKEKQPSNIDLAKFLDSYGDIEKFKW